MMALKEYYLEDEVYVRDVGYDDVDYKADLSAYKHFCTDLLTYVHTLEARIAKLEHSL